jgi:hypothetical protein
MRAYSDVINQPVSPATELEFRLVQAIVDADNEELLNLAPKAHGLWIRKEN